MHTTITPKYTEYGMLAVIVSKRIDCDLPGCQLPLYSAPNATYVSVFVNS